MMWSSTQVRCAAARILLPAVVMFLAFAPHATAQRLGGSGTSYGNNPAFPGMSSSSPTAAGAPNFSVGPGGDIRAVPGAARRYVRANFARMQKDSARIAELSNKLQQAADQPPKPGAQPEMDRELAEVEKLSREVRRLMTDQ